MVKSPDLLEGLLDKKVDRRKILEIAGVTGALATLAACSGNNYPENESASPSADIQRETADARPTPTPTTPEAVEQKPLPNPEQIVSREKMDKLFTLPSWGETLAEVKKKWWRRRRCC